MKKTALKNRVLLRVFVAVGVALSVGLCGLALSVYAVECYDYVNSSPGWIQG